MTSNDAPEENNLVIVGVKRNSKQIYNQKPILKNRRLTGSASLPGSTRFSSRDSRGMCCEPWEPVVASQRNIGCVEAHLRHVASFRNSEKVRLGSVG